MSTIQVTLIVCDWCGKREEENGRGIPRMGARLVWMRTRDREVTQFGSTSTVTDQWDFCSPRCYHESEGIIPPPGKEIP